MKKFTLSLFALASSIAPVFSQVVLQEGFTNPFNVTAAGWGTLNLSSTLGTVPMWFQGNSNVFSAYDGGATDYFASNFNAVGTGDISNWLFTPVVTIQDGAVLQFATRSDAQIRADRLQVRFSTAGANINITPASPSSVGTYSNLMLDINPLYSLATTSAVTNGTMVNGYPGTWTVYTLQVSGVPVATQGRFAFRAYIENGGPNGTNSNYLGIDGVKYTMPCGPTVQSFTTCANINTTLTAIGLPATSYSWSTGATGPSIVVNPASTTVYTLYPSANGAPCPSNVTATITTGPTLNVNIAASSTSICAGSSATLTANSSAPSYSWNSGQTVNQIVVTPASNTSYTVLAYAGNLPNPACAGVNTINISVLPTPTVNYSVAYDSGTLAGCPGGGFTITSTGASVYVYLFPFGTTTTNPIGVSTTTAIAPGAKTFTLGGIAANGCIAALLGTYSISSNPTVSIASKTIECVNKTLTLTASGANSYTWANTSSLTANPYTVSTGANTGTKVYVVTGKNAAGCTGSASRNVSIAACTGIENILGEVEDISAFPNPFTNELKISGFTGRVEIYNALGQQIVNTTITEHEVVNTSDFAKGAYLLKAYNANGEEVRSIKLLKN